MLYIKPTTIVACLLLINCSPAPTKIECKKFHEGTFKMAAGEKSVVIKRYAGKQLEYFDDAELPMSFDVTWIDDCSYTLRPDSLTLIKNPEIPKNSILTVKILRSSKNSYQIEARSNFSSTVLRDEVYKIK